MVRRSQPCLVSDSGRVRWRYLARSSVPLSIRVISQLKIALVGHDSFVVGFDHAFSCRQLRLRALRWRRDTAGTSECRITIGHGSFPARFEE